MHGPEAGGVLDVIGVRTHIDTIDGPLGRYVAPSVSHHTRCGLVWSCSGCNSIENAVVGMYNAVSVVK